MPERKRRWRKLLAWAFGGVAIAAIAFISFEAGNVYATIYGDDDTGTKHVSSVSEMGCPAGTVEDMSSSKCVAVGHASTPPEEGETFTEAPKMQTLLDKAKAGDAKAQQYVGSAYIKAKEPTKAFYWYMQSALQGRAPSQYTVSIMLADATGTQRNMTEALRWLKEAAHNHHVTAQLVFGSLLVEGRGVKKNVREGIKWINRGKATIAKLRSLTPPKPNQT